MAEGGWKDTLLFQLGEYRKLMTKIGDGASPERFVSKVRLKQ
jgi:hypothetical protein